MSLDEIRWYCSGAVILSAAIVIVLERLFPYDKSQRFLRSQLFNDFFLYTLVQSYVLGMGFSYLMEIIHSSSDLASLRFASEWPLALQLLLFVVLHDFYIYWFHRYQHASRFFWRIHEAHHSALDVDWLSGSRSHTLEIVINQSIEFGVIALLSGSPEIPVMKAALDGIWGMYIHSNINVRSGWLQHVINGPEMHRWHHATDIDAHNKNFSTKLAFWDWMFGTAFLPQQRKPRAYGLDDTDYPEGYIAQHAYAFRSFEQLDNVPIVSNQL
jgi:sterol desaturase/sphingolipid hydroxylase (fatty acid hydroxylase superfamily)